MDSHTRKLFDHNRFYLWYSCFTSDIRFSRLNGWCSGLLDVWIERFWHTAKIARTTKHTTFLADTGYFFRCFTSFDITNILVFIVTIVLLIFYLFFLLMLLSHYFLIRYFICYFLLDFCLFFQLFANECLLFLLYCWTKLLLLRGHIAKFFILFVLLCYFLFLIHDVTFLLRNQFWFSDFNLFLLDEAISLRNLVFWEFLCASLYFFWSFLCLFFNFFL